MVAEVYGARVVGPKPGRLRPYDDGFQPDGSVIYRYRGTDPQHPDNQAVRRAMRDKIPLIYFHGTVVGRYLAAWPAYVIDDDPASLSFHIDVDRTYQVREDPLGVAENNLQRRYAIRSTRQRLHQCAFRDRVLLAYKELCAICRLRHAELLDAAHIIPDVDPLGEPRVSNGRIVKCRQLTSKCLLASLQMLPRKSLFPSATPLCRKISYAVVT